MDGPCLIGGGDDGMRGRTIAQTLPLCVQHLLERKSSRDPSARVVRKLHALLSYVDTLAPRAVEEFGLG